MLSLLGLQLPLVPRWSRAPTDQPVQTQSKSTHKPSISIPETPNQVDDDVGNSKPRSQSVDLLRKSKNNVFSSNLFLPYVSYKDDSHSAVQVADIPDAQTVSTGVPAKSGRIRSAITRAASASASVNPFTRARSSTSSSVRSACSPCEPKSTDHTRGVSSPSLSFMHRSSASPNPSTKKKAHTLPMSFCAPDVAADPFARVCPSPVTPRTPSSRSHKSSHSSLSSSGKKSSASYQNSASSSVDTKGGAVATTAALPFDRVNDDRVRNRLPQTDIEAAFPYDNDYPELSLRSPNAQSAAASNPSAGLASLDDVFAPLRSFGSYDSMRSMSSSVNSNDSTETVTTATCTSPSSPSSSSCSASPSFRQRHRRDGVFHTHLDEQENNDDETPLADLMIGSHLENSSVRSLRSSRSRPPLPVSCTARTEAVPQVTSYNAHASNRGVAGSRFIEHDIDVVVDQTARFSRSFEGTSSSSNRTTIVQEDITGPAASKARTFDGNGWRFPLRRAVSNPLQVQK